MAVRQGALVLGSLVAVLSCSHPPATPAPGGGPAAEAAPGARGGGPGVPARRAPLSRDSVTKLRAMYVSEVMQRIAGRENEPDTVVFKNIQVLKDLTAGELVQKMDKDYGYALSFNCVNCHRLAPQGDFANDTSPAKKRARQMQQMVNDINHVELTKIFAQRTPQIDCATCHRGYGSPPRTNVLIPEVGKPGGPPPPTFNGRGRPPAGRPGEG